MGQSGRMPPLIVSSIAIVGIIWVMMVLGIRLYLRYKLNGPIGNDDYAAILATTLGIAQSAVVLAGVNSGLGSSVIAIDESLEQTTVKVSSAPSSSKPAARYTDHSWTDRLRSHSALSISNIRLKSFQLSTVHPLDVHSLASCCCLRGFSHERHRRVSLRSCNCVPVQTAYALERSRRTTVY